MYETENQKYQKELSELNHEEQRQRAAVNETKIWLEHFNRRRITVKQLTREALVELVDKIYVYPEQKIDIYFKFASVESSPDNLGWFPTMGMGVISNGIGDVISHLFLPSLCLSFGSMANFARISRSSMLEVIDQDYMKAVRAKGIRENVVIIKHGLKNALPPIVTVLGMRIAALMTGAIMIETIFSWPGIGRLIVDAINNNDFEMIQGTVLFMAILYVTVNLVVDIIYLYINPKVSYESERRAG